MNTTDKGTSDSDVQIEKTSAGNPRRRIRNYLIHAEVQLKVAYLSMLLSLFFALLLIWVLSSGISDAIQMCMGINASSIPVRHSVPLWKIGAAIFGFYSINCGTMLIYTHRLMGPMFVFRRHIQALREGKYSFRTRLRKTDFLSEFAADLNLLSEDLEKREGRAEV